MSALSPEQQLRAALKWALEWGIKANSYTDVGFSDHGCGCCSGDEVPPAEIDAIVREIRRELIEEKKI